MAAIERRMVPSRSSSPLLRNLSPCSYGRLFFLYFLHARRNGRDTHDPPRTTIHWNSIHDGGSSSAGTFGPSRIFFMITRAQTKEFACFRCFCGFVQNERNSIALVPMLVFWCNADGWTRNDGGWSMCRLRDGWNRCWKSLKITYCLMKFLEWVCVWFGRDDWKKILRMRSWNCPLIFFEEKEYEIWFVF